MSATATATLASPPGEQTTERVSLWRIPRSRSLLLLTVVGSIVGAVLLAARVYTDLLWFDEVDQVDVYWTTLTWKVLDAAMVGLGTACFVLLNLAAVERAVSRFPAAEGEGALAWQLWKHRPLLKPMVALACGLLAVSLRSGDAWQLLLLWTKRSDFGVEDPLFHRDVSFFVFSLPLYREVARWLLETVVMGAVISLAAYAAAGAFRTGQRRAALRAARRHLLVVTAVLLLLAAWWLRLEQYALALPHDPVTPGATSTDVTVRLPALRALAIVVEVAAGVCLYACVGRAPIVVPVVLALAAAVGFEAKSDLPELVHRFTVQPQALSRERPHVADAIAFTRRAYGLDRVRVETLPMRSELSRADLARARQTADNVPLWDERVLRPAMNELQAIGRYYRFPSVTVDRYDVDGKPRVVSLGARELSLRRLGFDDRSWATDRFAYTHGYGVAAVEGGDADEGHYPRFTQRAFRTGGALRLREPRVFFGEQPTSDPPYVVLDTRRAEVDEPASGDVGPSYHYGGDGGIAMSDPIRRLALAARFKDLDLLLSETVTDRSRILLHRDVDDRLRTVAPFLRWDDRAQTAIIDGRVQFLFDGYTTSSSYPYSAPVKLGGDTVNYVNAAARAAVDAYSGRVTIYAASDDPILRAWRAVYPNLIVPPSRMPAEMRAHLRYPRQLFEAQADAYERYHADDATAFWNGSDAWARALQIAGPVEQAGELHFPNPAQRVDADERREEEVNPRRLRMEPSYGLARLPRDRRERFMLTLPFTPRGRENLVGYLAGSVDAGGRPRLTALSLPRDRLTAGPTQVTRRILSSSGVVRRLRLLNRESRDLGKSGVSRTVLGAPRVVPIAGTLVHVQPLFLTAGGEGVPRLQLVAVNANGRIGYGRDFASALRRSVERSSGR